MSSQRKGVKYLIFAEFSRKEFYPSISRQREGQKIQSFHKNFSLIFNCWLFSDFGQFIFVDFLWSRKRAKQKSVYTGIKESAGTLLSLQNDVLSNGFEIQRRDCYRTQTLANSTKTHRVVDDGIFSLHTAGIGWLCHISILHRIQL